MNKNVQCLPSLRSWFTILWCCTKTQVVYWLIDNMSTEFVSKRSLKSCTYFHLCPIWSCLEILMFVCVCYEYMESLWIGSADTQSLLYHSEIIYTKK